MGYLSRRRFVSNGSPGWMSIESAVAIGACIIAHSISLAAFGIDSLIELASAGVLIWRLSVELK